MSLPPVVGHRGAAAYAPENTLESIRKAAELGAPAVEVDVMLTADGQPVLFHDDLLDRTTDGSGPIAEHTLAEIETLDAGAWFSPSFRGVRIPRLAEALELALDLGLRLNLEIKPSPGQDVETTMATGAAVDRLWPRDLTPPLISSYSQLALETARARNPSLPRAILYRSGRVGDWIAAAEPLGTVAIHAIEGLLRPAAIRAIKDAGFLCGAFTVNTTTRARVLRNSGVDYVFTDMPDRILGAFARS